MTLVAVVYILLDAQLLERQHTTDTQQDLLLNTVLPVTTIQLVRDLTIPLRVEVVVGIQQVQIHTTYGYAPEISVYVAVGVGHIHYHRRTVSVLHLRNRQVAEVLCLVVSDLLSLWREGLGEIAITIEETDGRHIDVAVAGFLQVVTGQDSQTAGIDLNHLAQTVLHREISDARLLGILRLIHISAEIGIYLIQLLHEYFVLAQGLHLLVAQDVEQYDRIRLRAMPFVQVNTAEEILCLMVPNPP